MSSAKPSKGATVAPVTFTDATAPAVTGFLSARAFRRFVLEHGIPHARAGRRIIVRVDRYLEAIDRLAGAESSAPWSEDDVIARAAGTK